MFSQFEFCFFKGEFLSSILHCLKILNTDPTQIRIHATAVNGTPLLTMSHHRHSALLLPGLSSRHQQARCPSRYNMFTASTAPPYTPVYVPNIYFDHLMRISKVQKTTWIKNLKNLTRTVIEPELMERNLFCGAKIMIFWQILLIF